jgi:CoA:oxalate CoA-transferase
MGSEVLKIEPPSGDPVRSAPPFASGTPAQETSALFLHLNAGKCGVTLDLDSARGRKLFLSLAVKADVVIESFAPGRMTSLGLAHKDLQRANPRIILTSITPFGEGGPYSRFRATEIGLRAASGEMYLAGQPHQPLKKGGNIGQYLGGLNGFIGAMGALFQREATGLGRHIDVSMTESLTSIVGQALREQAASGFIPGRRQGGLGWPNNIYECKDGYMMTFTAYAVGDAWWPPFAEMVADGEAIEVPKSPPRDPESQQEWDDRLRSWLSKRTRRQAHEEAQSRGLAFGYLATAPDLLASPQLQHRRFFSEVEHPVAGDHRVMNLPFLIDGERLPVRRAPLLGEHNREVYGGLLGLGEDVLAGLEEAGVI